MEIVFGEFARMSDGKVWFHRINANEKPMEMGGHYGIGNISVSLASIRVKEDAE